jgi:hypothetical protein
MYCHSLTGTADLQLLVPAGSVIEFQLRPQFLREEPPLLVCSLLAFPVLVLNNQVVHPYWEISYSLAISESSPESYMNVVVICFLLSEHTWRYSYDPADWQWLLYWVLWWAIWLAYRFGITSGCIKDHFILFNFLFHYVYNRLKPSDTELCQFILLILSSNCLKTYL